MNERARMGAATAAAVLFPFAVYLATIAPAVYFGDSGELNIAAFALGIPHVPGYPLYTLVGKLATFLPLGGIAFRMNLLSATCTALAIGLFFRLCTRVNGDRAAALAAALALAFTGTLWEHSLRSVAYPMNLLFGSAVLLAAVRWWEGGGDRYLLLAAFLFGLGLGNHEILLVTFLPVLVLAIARRTPPAPATIASAVFFLFLGLSVYLYLPVRSAANPALDWGNPETVRRLLDVLLQRQYAHKMLGPALGPKIEMAGLILRQFPREFTVPVFLVGLLGIAVMARRARALLVGLLLLVVANIVLRVNYIGGGEFDQIHRYVINAFAALAIAAAFGLAWVFAAIRGRAGRATTRWAIPLLAAALIASPLAAHLPSANLARHWLAHEYARGLLSPLEHGALLFVGGDNDIYPIWDLQGTARFREDVVAMGKPGFYADWLRAEYGARTDPSFFNPPADLPPYEGVNAAFHAFFVNAIQSGQFPVYSLYNDADDPAEAARWRLLRERFAWWPAGLELAFSRPDRRELFRAPEGDFDWRQIPRASLLDPDLVRDAHTREVLSTCADFLFKSGRAALAAGNAARAAQLFGWTAIINPGDLEAALGSAVALGAAGRLAESAAVLEALAKDPRADVRVFLSLGRVRLAQGDLAAAERALARARELDPGQEEVRRADEDLERARSDGGAR